MNKNEKTFKIVIVNTEPARKIFNKHKDKSSQQLMPVSIFPL